MGALKKIGVGLFLGVGFLVIVSQQTAKKNQGEQQTPAATQQAALETSPASNPPPEDGVSKPSELKTGPEQTAFNDTIAKFRDAYSNAQNELAKGAARQARAEELCKLLRKRAVSNWVGFLTKLSSNSDGYGVISVKIGDGVEVKTWNNDLSDINDNTLIKASSPVMAAAINMQEGQAVKFSGTFIRGDADCIKESSLTQSGSMRSPEFIVRFTSLSPVDE